MIMGCQSYQSTHSILTVSPSLMEPAKGTVILVSTITSEPQCNIGVPYCLDATGSGIISQFTCPNAETSKVANYLHEAEAVHWLACQG